MRCSRSLSPLTIILLKREKQRESQNSKGMEKRETQKAVKVALSLFPNAPHFSDQQVASIAGLEESLVTQLRACSGQVHSLKQLLQQTFSWSNADLDYLQLD